MIQFSSASHINDKSLLVATAAMKTHDWPTPTSCSTSNSERLNVTRVLSATKVPKHSKYYGINVNQKVPINTICENQVPTTASYGCGLNILSITLQSKPPTVNVPRRYNNLTTSTIGDKIIFTLTLMYSWKLRVALSMEIKMWIRLMIIVTKATQQIRRLRKWPTQLH